MKRLLLLMVLALGMCSINVCAQTKKQPATNANRQSVQVMKFKQIGEDGYVWYKLKKGNLFGARDNEGNNIIPIKYDMIEYNTSEVSGYHYFTVKKGEYSGSYTREGTMVISPERHYNTVFLNCSKGMICWEVTNKNSKMRTILDAKGNELFSVECDAIWFTHSVSRGQNSNPGTFPEYPYFQIRNGGFDESGTACGICDLNGNILLQPEPQYHFLELRAGGKELAYWDQDKKCHFMTFNYNPNTVNDYQPYESLYYAFKVASSSSNSSLSSNTTNSSNNSETGTTQTVVVEHHRDPVPVQEWQACIGCGGMGTMGCHSCGGSGTKYIGDRLHRCGLCNGQGIIPCNVCYGNKGKYVTVYR